MKKFIGVLTVLLMAGLLMSPSGYARDEFTMPTTEATDSRAVVTGTGVLHGIFLNTDGTNNITLNIWDNTAASGTTLIPADTVVPTSATVRSAHFTFNPPIRYQTGVYVGVSATGDVSYVVYHRPR